MSLPWELTNIHTNTLPHPYVCYPPGVLTEKVMRNSVSQKGPVSTPLIIWLKQKNKNEKERPCHRFTSLDSEWRRIKVFVTLGVGFVRALGHH